MHHKLKKKHKTSLMKRGLKSAQKGSSLVIGIFILVVMSILGASLIEIMKTNEEAFTYEVLGTRAYNAAQSGLQWEMQQLFPLRDATNPNSSDSSMCQSLSLDLSTINGLQGCSAIVECTSFTHELTTTYYNIKSIGQCEINGEVTSRTIEVSAKTID